MTDKSSEVRSLLRRALEDTVSLDEASSFMSTLCGQEDEVVQWGAHFLIHFLDDADIRERDPAYDAYMRGEAHSLMKQLKARKDD